MLREDELKEFKRTTGELNEAMISISAMLNKHGSGTIYFGLRNNGEPFRFTINDSTLRDISRKIYEAIRPQIFPVIDTVSINDTEVITVRFEGNEAPYAAFGKYYIRIADEDRELSPAELRRIMIGKEYEENWENHTSQETIDDIDENTLQRFYTSATECGRFPDFGTEKSVILSKLGVLNHNYLSNAGRCLFSKNKPVVLKMAVFATDHKTTFLDMIREEGNIFQLIDSAMHYIIRNIRWRVDLSEDGIHRKEIPEIPIDAIREAVINSFAHARYDGIVQHEIDIFSNRIAIVNPGSFANSFEPIDFATRDLHSYLRNERIARTLYLCKDVETFGSGIRKIYTLCDSTDVKISYINNENDFTFQFSRADRNIMPKDGTLNGTINDTITELEAELLKLLRKDPYAKAPELAEKTRCSLRTINRSIASLKNKRLLKRIGSNKTGYWKVE